MSKSVSNFNCGELIAMSLLLGLLADPNNSLIAAPRQQATVHIDTHGSGKATAAILCGTDFEDAKREDVMNLPADLKPGFIRFFSGDGTAGGSHSTAYRWKTAVPAVTNETGAALPTQPGSTNREWTRMDASRRSGAGPPAKSESMDGVGYHEYLALCEKLHAQPWFVVNCGMAFGESAGQVQSSAWIQDAADAVEYAVGPVDQKWGGLRAANGHPAPFAMPVMEIGNENGGLTYNQHKNFKSGEYGGAHYEPRFLAFQRALQAKYPGIRIMANGFLKDSNPDLVDEHLEAGPEWFVSSASRYDSYDRQGPGICIGSFHCNDECGQGNLRAALSEAAFMTGLERNGDLVRMACYGPLLVNGTMRTMSPGAIRYNDSACYGTPSYYVQKLFSLNRGDRVLPVRVISETKMPKGRGGIGLGTWRTQAEFKDVQVMQGDKVLYRADFNEGNAGRDAGAPGAAGWKPVFGNWVAQDGCYRQMMIEDNTHSLAGSPQWSDYTLSLKARKLGGEEGFQLRFYAREGQGTYWWNIGGWRNICHAIEKSAGTTWPLVGVWPITISDRIYGQIETGRWYDIRIELQGARMRCYLDGKLIHDCQDPALLPLAVVASRVDKTGEIIIKAVNHSEIAQETNILLEGAPEILPEGTAWTLTSPSLEDENSFEHPEKIIPVSQELNKLANNFRHTFPPHSLTVLRLKTK